MFYNEVVRGSDRTGKLLEVQKEGEVFMIVQCRIDERLIHGQVAAAWARVLDITHIVCASDIAVKDPLRTKALLMATSPGKKVFIKSVNDTIQLLSDPRADKMKIFVITDNPSDTLKLVNALPINDVNIANYHKKDVKEKIFLHSVCVTDREEIKIFEELAAKVEKFYTQLLPSLDAVSFDELIKNVKKS